MRTPRCWARIRTISLLLAVACLLNLSMPPASQGQTGAVTWDLPIRLSHETALIHSHTAVADPWGVVHVFWAADEGYPSNAIYYTYSDDGKTWVDPYDIVVGPNWAQFSAPYATCDDQGTLHLLWAGTDGLYYSQAYALEASRTSAWSAPQLLVSASSIWATRLVVDDAGIIHVFYSRRVSGANVEYIRSEDNGVSWSTPAQVSRIASTDPQAPDFINVAIDSKGALHVVWSENYPPDFLGRQVLYARSTDRGNTWTEPLALSELAPVESSDTGGTLWNASILLAIDSEDYLHVVWVCGRVRRCYRMSDDGGRSWSAAEPIFGNLLGVSGWDTMASDPYGSVFWVGTLRYPQAVYASVLRDGTWREPPRPLITQAFHLGLAGAHFPHLVVSRGNQLHLVLVEGDGGPLWYLHGQSDLPKDATQPTPWPRVVQMASPSPTPEATSDITTPISEEEPGQSVQLGVSLNPVVWAIAPVLLVLAIVFKVFRQRTR